MKKIHKNYWLLILIVFSLFIVAGCGPAITREIKYEVTGTVSHADITYENFTGATDKLSNVDIPWSKLFTVTIEYDSSFRAYLMARNSTNGSITVNIYVNGILVKTSTDSGSSQYVSISEYINNY